MKILGDVKYYTKKADSGLAAHEGFCPECGSRDCAYAQSMPGLMLITAGTLNQPEKYRPQMDLYVGRANHWDNLCEYTTKFDAMPTES